MMGDIDKDDGFWKLPMRRTRVGLKNTPAYQLVFDGEPYYYGGGTAVKEAAEREVAWYRKHGYKARYVKRAGGYAVYQRKVR
jgi:hypothetical protein